MPHDADKLLQLEGLLSDLSEILSNDDLPPYVRASIEDTVKHVSNSELSLDGEIGILSGALAEAKSALAPIVEWAPELKKSDDKWSPGLGFSADDVVSAQPMTAAQPDKLSKLEQQLVELYDDNPHQPQLSPADAKYLEHYVSKIKSGMGLPDADAAARVSPSAVMKALEEEKELDTLLEEINTPPLSDADSTSSIDFAIDLMNALGGPDAEPNAFTPGEFLYAGAGKHGVKLDESFSDAAKKFALSFKKETSKEPPFHIEDFKPAPLPMPSTSILEISPDDGKGVSSTTHASNVEASMKRVLDKLTMKMSHQNDTVLTFELMEKMLGRAVVKVSST